MASGPENNQPRNQEQHSGQFSQSDQPPAASNYPPSGGNYYPPSAMNYPQQPYPGIPPQGYPGYAAGYNPYPAAAYGHHDPYYAPQTYSQADDGGNACFRCICMIILLSLMLTLTATIIMFFVNKPEHGSFKVDSFSVSNFNLNPGNKVLSGKWDAKVSAQNPSGSRLNMDKVESNLYQKDVWLASGPSGSFSGYWNDFDSNYNSPNLMEFKFEANNVSAPAEEMEKEIKEAGGVTFNLRLNLMYVSRSSGFFFHMRRGSMKVTCKDLKLGLSVGANSGSLITDGKPKDCEISNG